MLQRFKDFLQEEEGMGVVEIIIIIAVLVTIALFFRRNIMNFVSNLTKDAMPDIGNTTEDQIKVDGMNDAPGGSPSSK